MNARPSDSLAIAVAQLNSTVGDIAGNAEKVRRARLIAAAQGADLVVLALPVGGGEQLVIEHAVGLGAAGARGLVLPTRGSASGMVMASGKRRSRRAHFYLELRGTSV